MSTFRKLAIASFTVLALGAVAHARGNAGGGGGGPAGNGEPGGVMQPLSAAPSHAQPRNERRRPRGELPQISRAKAPIHCSSGADGTSPARCQWN